jgi:glycosyltransferase involved in cell wall biosynthesis
MPEISVVTPSYQQLRWLKLCAASVADQRGVEFEHIVQDAGTGAELRDWAAANPHVKLFVEKDNGMYDAINRGFRRASGEILAWLNCDEQYLPGTLAKVAAWFAVHPQADVLFGDAVLVDARGELLSYRRAILPSLLHVQLAHLNTLSCATFVRRSVIERGFFLNPEWKTIADGVWVADMLKARILMGVLEEPLAAFTILENNLGQSTVARDERRRFLQSAGALRAGLRAPVVLLHRARKFLHGAYVKRNLTTEIYTQDSPGRRKRVSAENISFGWKKSSQPDNETPA